MGSEMCIRDRVHIKEELEKLFKCPVDVVRLRNNMDELLRNCINKDGIYV